MAHFHSQEEARVFYLDQLCTIGLVGALGGVGFMMWWRGLLDILLASQFHLLVLAGSIALVMLVAIRGVVLWQAVGRTTIDAHEGHHHEHDDCCGHDHGHDHAHDHHHHHEHGEHHHHDHDHDHDHGHEHGPGCDHAHEQPTEKATPAPAAPGHDHGHDHDHGWSPWRYAVLLLPIFLYLMGLPNEGFSQKHVEAAIQGIQPENTDIDAKIPMRGDQVLPLDFTELKQAAFLPAQRGLYEGQVGRLLGQFYPGSNENTCRLVRFKMVCCAADVTFLNITIISPEKLTGFQTEQWVEVTGQIQFRKRKDRDEYLPVLQIKGRDQITPANRPVNPNL